MISGSISEAVTLEALVAGDVVCAANATQITRATPSNLKAAGVPLGFALGTYAVGATAQYAGVGTTVDTSVSLLGAGDAGPVVVDSSARAARQRHFSGAEYRIGFANTAGQVSVYPKGRSGSVSPVCNVLSYGATGLQADDIFGANDQDPAIRAALADVQANFDTPKTLFFPGIAKDTSVGAVYNLARPLRVTSHNVRIAGSHCENTALRANFAGPIIIAGPAQTPPVAAPLLPGGHSWDTNTGGWLNFTDTGAVNLDGLTACTVEFALLYDDSVTAGTRSIISSAGREMSDDVNSNTCFSLYVRGSDIGGVDNELVGTLTTVNGDVALVAPTALVTGSTYHVALSYDGTNVRLYCALIGAGTSAPVATQALTGALKQGVYETVRFGAICYNGFGGATVHYGIEGRIDAIRISNSARYGAAAYTIPTTKWSVVLADVNALFVLNFDEIVDGDVVVGYVNNLSNKVYMPTMSSTDVAKSTMLGLEIENLTFMHGTAKGSSVFMQICIGARLKNLEMKGGHYGLQMVNNCFLCVVDTVRAAGGVTSQYVIGMLGAANENTLRNIHVAGGHYGIVITGSSPVMISNAYIVQWGSRFGILGDTSLVAMNKVTISGETRLTPCAGAGIFGGLYGGVFATADCVFDPHWIEGIVPSHTLRCATPITIVGGTRHVIDGASFGMSPNGPCTEAIGIRIAPVTPVLVRMSTKPSLFPWSLAPHLVCYQGSDGHEQAGGYRKWIHKGISQTVQDIGEQMILRTAIATPTALPLSSDGATSRALKDNAVTRFDITITASATDFSWSKSWSIVRLVSRVGSTVVVSTSAATTEDLGTVPGGVNAEFAITGTTSWQVLATGVAATNVDWDGTVIARDRG